MHASNFPTRLTFAAAMTVAVALGLMPSARADTLTTFDLVGATFEDGSMSATGTVTIDTTAGQFAAVNLLVTDTSPSQGGSAHFTNIDGQLPFDNGTDYYFYSFDAAGNLIDLELPKVSLVGYMGSVVCAGQCPSVGYVTLTGAPLNRFTAGALVPVPEATEGMMLAAGAGVLALFSRQRKKQGSHLPSR